MKSKVIDPNDLTSRLSKKFANCRFDLSKGNAGAWMILFETEGRSFVVESCGRNKELVGISEIKEEAENYMQGMDAIYGPEEIDLLIEKIGSLLSKN